MALLTTPGWLENAGEIHSAAEMRSYIGALLAGTRSTSTDLVPLGGVHPGMGTNLGVTQTGSPSMAVEVLPGAAWIPGSESSTQGAYGILNDSNVTIPIDSAHISLPRIDLIVVRVRDSDYSGVNDDAEIIAVTGTPDSAPVPPSAPDNSLILARIAVGAGVSSIANADITQAKRYLAAAGGVIVHDAESNLFTGTNIYDGQLQYSRDNGRLFLWNGTSNLLVWDQNIQGTNRLPRGIMANPATTTFIGSVTSGTNEVRDNILGNYVFTSEGSTRRYRVVFSGASFTLDTTSRVIVRIRDGGADTPTTSSTMLSETWFPQMAAGVASRRSPTISAPFIASSGTHTLSVFWQAFEGGAISPASERFLYVEDIGRVYT